MSNRTIIISEPTRARLKKLMKIRNAKDFDDLISMLIQEAKELPATMFGVDRKLHIKYTQKEHEEFAKENR